MREVFQQVVTGGTARGFVVSYDAETKVLKYVQDRSTQVNQTSFDTLDYVGVSTNARLYSFESNSNPVTTTGGFSGSIETGFTGVTTDPTGTKYFAWNSVYKRGC